MRANHRRGALRAREVNRRIRLRFNSAGTSSGTGEKSKKGGEKKTDDSKEYRITNSEWFDVAHHPELVEGQGMSTK